MQELHSPAKKIQKCLTATWALCNR